MQLLLSARVAQLVGVELRGLSWLLSYSLQALAWAALASILVRWRPLSSAQRHTLWKAALLGPLLLTLFASSVPGKVGGSYGPAREVVLVSHGDGNASATVAPPAAASANDSRRLQLTEDSARRLGKALDVLGACALSALALGLLRFAASAVMLWRRLAHREPLHDERLLRRLAQVRARFGLPPVRLSQSAELDSPLVLGAAEICVPLSTLAELGDAELDAVLGHELAHLERHDGLWFPLVGLLEAALWWHPLARGVSMRIRQTAELACDERCVELLGQPRALARALTQIAAHASAVQRALAVPTMTRPRTGLTARVARLMSAPPRVGARPATRGGVIVVVSVIAGAAVSLGVGIRVAESRPLSAESAAAAPPAAANLRGEDDDVTKLSQQMIELARREQQIQTELEHASRHEAATAPSPRELELRQELEHAQQMQLWLEQRLVSH